MNRGAWEESGRLELSGPGGVGQIEHYDAVRWRSAESEATAHYLDSVSVGYVARRDGDYEKARDNFLLASLTDIRGEEDNPADPMALGRNGSIDRGQVRTDELPGDRYIEADTVREIPEHAMNWLWLH
jgi:hypothetical protein